MSEVQELPQGWSICNLGEICHIERGITFPASAKVDRNSVGSIACLRTTNVQTTINWHDLIYVPQEYVKSENKLIHQEDILISMANSKELVGKVSFVNQVVIESTFGGFIAAIRSGNFINSKYLFYYFRSSFVRQKMRAIASQTVNIANLSLEGIYSVPIFVAPLLEQQRIVEALEQQLSRLDAGVVALRSTQQKLKRYRASVLKAAVEGKLTEEWRKNHLEVEPAPELLKRILQERRAKWEEEQIAKGRDLQKVKYEELAGPDMKGLSELPKGWCWTSMGQCFEVHVGATPSRKEPTYWGGYIPWISSGEVRFNRIKSTKEHITLSGLRNSSTQLNPTGSVLLGMIGEGKTRGQVALLDIEASNNQNCAAIWVSQTPIISEYIYYWLWSQYEVTRRGNSGNNQPALNKFKVEQFVFPLIPLAEQEQIVSLIEERLSIVATLESTIEQVLKRAERMRQSILHRAFTGKLVAQDPNDEPASVLLERIRREREEATAPQKLKHLVYKANGKSSRKRVAESTQPYLLVDVPDPEPVDAQATTQGGLWD